MTATQILEAVRRNRARAAQAASGASTQAPAVSTAPASPQAAPGAVQAIGGVSPQPMQLSEVLGLLTGTHGTSGTGAEDGTRVHIHYESFGKATAEAIKCAARAAELGLPRDRYTGRVHRLWKTKAGDHCVTIWVELERDHMYRTLNLQKGKVYRLVVLGD